MSAEHDSIRPTRKNLQQAGEVLARAHGVPKVKVTPDAEPTDVRDEAVRLTRQLSEGGKTFGVARGQAVIFLYAAEQARKALEERKK